MAIKLSEKKFRGPWAGLPIAWDGRLRFDEAAYREDVARCCKVGVPGVYTGGTTGEFYAIELDEFKAVTTATIAVAREYKVPVMIGCTSTYTLGAAKRAAFAAEAGANAIQVALPYWMEVPDAQIIPFYKEVSSAAPGLALSVYETPRAKKTLTLDQHRGIKDAISDYWMVKANSGTIGSTADGCRELAKIVNVFVTERRFAELGRVGATGGCSSMVYWFPLYVLDLWKQVEAADWAEADRRCAVLADLVAYLQTTFAGRGFMDSAVDRMGSQIRPFLALNLRSRGPYPHANESDVAKLRRWCAEHDPMLLKP